MSRLGKWIQLFFVLEVLLCHKLMGQAKVDLSGIKALELLVDHKDIDTSYIRATHRKFSPRLFFGTKLISFGFGKSEQDAGKLKYYPNVASFIGAGIFYKTIGFNFSYLLERQKRGPEDKLGKTNFFDFELKTYQVKYGIVAQYQDYKGFYVAKTGVLSAGSLEPFPLRSDLHLRNVSLQWFGIQNWKRFSMQAPFQHTRRQLKSAGSFLYMGNGHYMSIKGDSVVNTNLATDVIRRKQAQAVGFLRGRFISFSPLAGYGHTFVVYRSLFVTGVFFAGPGMQVQNLKQESGATRAYISPYLATNTKLALGYNGMHFFFSAQAMADNARNYYRGVRLQATNSNVMFQAGYRF